MCMHMCMSMGTRVCVCVCLCICEECNRSSDLDRNSQTTVLQYIYYIQAVNNALFCTFSPYKEEKKSKNNFPAILIPSYFFNFRFTSFSVYICIPCKKICIENNKKKMMGLRSSKNCFLFFIFLSLFIGKNKKQSIIHYL